MNYTKLRPAPLSCRACAYYPNDCEYCVLDGKTDKYGNKTKINFDMLHNCHDWHPIAIQEGK